MNTAAAVASAPGALPLLGHGLRLVRDPLAFLSSLPAHGDLVRVGLGPHRVVMVCDPQLTRQVLLDTATFDKGGPLYDRLGELLGRGLATCPAGEHRRLRRLSQPSFQPDRMAVYAGAMSDLAAGLADSWEHGQVVDVARESNRLTTRILVRAMFSASADERLHEHMIDDVETVVRCVFRRSIAPEPVNRIPTRANRRYERALSRMRGHLGDVIAARRADPADHGDLLSALLRAGESAGPDADPALTEQEIADQVMTFFVAGTKSTASTLAWALHLLATHPREQARIQDEADRAPATGWAPTAGRAPGASPPALPEAEQVITETLRLYPPGWLLTRQVTRDTTLGATPIAAGTTVAFSPWILHRRPDLYPDPDRFVPGRWATGQTRGAYIPFGAGARQCIGGRFAVTEMALALTHIASRWQLVPAGRAPRVAAEAALVPQGLRLRVLARDPARRDPAGRA
ncbi:cytochrome P450 [Kitasatospora sp. NPDC093806]|uniref:cytochrome P450 n=1 Tax=Kitasatospora sp. NPDC093806 TaxID=3155075 RepID=UPI00341AA68C